MRRLIGRIVALVVLLAALLWTVDWLVLRRRVAQNGDAFGDLEVHYRYAVHLKNKRIEQRAEKETVECVHSMFPHYNDTPCWYLKRHTNQFQELNGSPWHFFYDE